MTIKQIFNEDKKYILNTPKYIIKRFYILINHKNIQPNQKKVLQELKNILIGKYSTEQALKNSIKGIKNKVNFLNEKVLSKLDKLIFSLATAFSVFGSLPFHFYKRTDIKPVVAIERNINASNTMARLLTVEVDEKTWESIIDILNRIEEQLNNGSTLDDAYASEKENLNTAGIDIVKYLPGSASGRYISRTKRIELNINNTINTQVREFTDSLTRDNAWIKYIANEVKESNIETLKHELIHKAQFKKLNSLISKMIELRYSMKNKSYEQQMVEVGAYHASIEQFILNKNLDTIKLLSKQIARNIIEVYPDSDPVVKAIKEYVSLGEVSTSTLNLKPEQAVKMKAYIEELQKNKVSKEIIETALANYKEEQKNAN